MSNPKETERTLQEAYEKVGSYGCKQPRSRVATNIKMWLLNKKHTFVDEAAVADWLNKQERNER